MKLQGLENIILETDSPYLSPVPKRGKENEPSNLAIIGEYTADFFRCRKKGCGSLEFFKCQCLLWIGAK